MEGVPSHARRLLDDPEGMLANFTMAADMTVLSDACRFVHSGDSVVARYYGLPFAALAFIGHDRGLLASLSAKLVDFSEDFYVLLNETQAQLAEETFAVQRVHLEWQMVFTGEAAGCDVCAAAILGPEDIPQMQELALEVGLMALEENPLRCGPAFGMWADGMLAAMGATHLRIPGAAEIGNIATRTAYRRRGYARQVVAALVRAHVAERRRVFLMVFQTNDAATRLYERLGFVRLRPMSLMHCRLRANNH